MSLNVEEPYKEEEVLYQVQVRLNSRGRERVLKVKVYKALAKRMEDPQKFSALRHRSRSRYLNYNDVSREYWSELFLRGRPTI